MTPVLWILAIALALLLLLLSGLGLRALFGRAVDRRAAAFENDLIARHYDEVENMYRQMRGWRHDYHNHIQVMKALRGLGENARLDAYLSQLDADLATVDTLIRSGNIMVDAILNSKLSLAKHKNIAVDAAASVPQSLPIPEVELCSVIGNLLDNAIEATLRLDTPGDRMIRVYIARKRDALYLSVTNTARGTPRKAAGRYLSSKTGQYGLGLLRVDHIIARHGGYLRREAAEGAFTTEILIPLGNGGAEAQQ